MHRRNSRLTFRRVEGLLLAVAARDRMIGQIDAGVFYRAMAEVGSIRTLHIEHDMASALFQCFLPGDEPLNLSG